MDKNINRRRGVAFLGEEDIALLLNLPEGYQVVGVRGDFMRNGIAVMVTSPDLAEVPEGCAPPELRVKREIRAERVEIDGEWTSQVTGLTLRIEA